MSEREGAARPPAPARSWDALIAASGLPRLEARALLELASGRGRSWLVAHGDEVAPADVAARFESLGRRRRDGEPLAYLTGVREFHGLSLRVDPSVLIPRADTETLVELAIRLAPPGARLLDLGTGSGAVAVAVAAARPDLRVTATDLSERALSVAARNAAECLPADRPGGPIRWFRGSWWQALPAGEPAFEVVASNPPYIAAGDPHLSEGDLRFEPPQALASGADGLDAIRAIAAGARPHLAPGGWLMLEHGFDQGAPVRALLAAEGLDEVATHADAEGRDRVTAGRAPASGCRPPR